MNGEKVVSIEAKSFIDEDGNLFFDVGFQDGKELIEKRLSVSTFIALLDGNLREEEKYVVFPKLASNVYAAKISSSDKSSFDCLSIYKAEKRAFSIAGELLRIPFPTLLMHTRIRNGARNELHIFALDTDEPDDHSLVYEYPFANVYKDGSVCMGNIVSRQVSSIKEIDTIFDDFICGITNDHLYHLQNKLGLTQLELVNHIKEKDTYPKELLLENGNTMESLIKKFGLA